MQGTPITFNYTGDVQTYTVPQRCIQLIVDCVGGAGSRGNDNGVGDNPGSFGGRVQCKLTVTSGQVLNIYVGGGKLYGYGAGGWNGGGAGGSSEGGCPGGGASDIRIGGTELTDRKVVAGGGGGGNWGCGGNGGGLTGGDGAYQYANGKGGTQSAGGAGGTSASGNGNNGQLGQGAAGLAYVSYGHTYPYAGGGGGYYGGGGEGVNEYGMCGAGGGSSYTDPDLCTDVVHTQGYSEATGNGWITLTPILNDTCERDSTKDGIIELKTPTTTYNSFITAGYDTLGTQNGVYLIDLSTPITRLDVTDYTYTVDANDNVVLDTYTGASTNVIIPEIEEVIV